MIMILSQSKMPIKLINHYHFDTIYFDSNYKKQKHSEII